MNGGGHPSGFVQPPAHSDDAAAPVLTGAGGMAIINEMFQRQARRLETQQSSQFQDRQAVEYAQAQLLVMQAQLQWHASRYQEREKQVQQSSDTISRMQSYVGAMESERARAVETAAILARDVNGLRQQMETSQPEQLEILSTTLSDMAMRGTDLTALEGIGQLFQPSAHTGGSSAGSAGTSASAASTIDAAAGGRSCSSYGGLSGSASGSQQLGSGSGSGTGSGSGSGNGSGSGSDGENGGQGSSSNQEGKPWRTDNDNSSSDSNDNSSSNAASAASTWPHAVAIRRSGIKHAPSTLAPERVPNREGSPPENDSASGDSNNGSHTRSGNGTSSANGADKDGSEPKSEGETNGSKSDENGSSPPRVVDAQPPMASYAAVPQGVVGGLPPAVANGGGDAPGAAAHLAGLPESLLSSICNTNAPGAATQSAGELHAAQLAAVTSGLAAAGPGGVLQGVLPFPGQGVVELQQGVIVEGALEEFHGIGGLLAASGTAPASAGNGVWPQGVLGLLRNPSANMLDAPAAGDPVPFNPQQVGSFPQPPMATGASLSNAPAPSSAVEDERAAPAAALAALAELSSGSGGASPDDDDGSSSSAHEKPALREPPEKRQCVEAMEDAPSVELSSTTAAMDTQ